ncbi:MAG: ATP-binding protein, partial [Bacteroidota bacterium]
KAKEGRKQELIGLQAVMDVELNTQRYENKLQQQELALQKTFLQRLQIALAAIIVLAIALAIALWRIAVANRKLAEKNAQLADFNIQLATTNQQLSLANNKLQQFAFATGHDLKESLRNITSFAQLATIEIGENNNTARSHLQEAAAGGKRMRKMLDDLLHFSNIGGNDTVVASFPLQEIVSSVKQQLKEDIVEKQGDVHLKTPVTIKANRMAIEQLMYNLVHNGLKYQEPGRPPRISIEVDKQGEDVVFQVRDNGRGVPAADRKKIFQPFHRLLNRMESGSGLGLSICQNVVEDHGGRIWYEVGDPTGSVFCFTLPKAEPKGAFLMATT